MKKAGLNGFVYDFSVHYNIIDTTNIINIYKYLIVTHDVKIMFRLIKKYLWDY